jgi:hypothetical protein
MVRNKKAAQHLRKKGATLSQIVAQLGIPKTTAYGYIRSIPLNARRTAELKQQQSMRVSLVAARRKGVSLRAFAQFAFTIRTTRLVAHLLFDGEVSRRGCAYHNRNTSLISEVRDHMRDIYTYPPTEYTNKTTGVHRLSYFNVALGAYLLTKSLELLGRIRTAPHEEQRAFLQAFFDDEGCADFREKRNVRQVRGYQKNISVLECVIELLHVFGVQSHFSAPNEVVISGKGALSRFEKEIGFSKGVRVNGARSNSIWKRSLEKRVILRRAVESFD